MKKPKSGKKHTLLTVLLSVATALVVLANVGWGALSVSLYDENFNQRFESYEPITYRLEDFEGLKREKYEFPSDKGQMLTGYLYTAGQEAPRGIIIIAHGFGGGGHNSYMDCANYFAQHGYAVFAYDATGNDESEGDGVGGVPQGTVDLDYAISFVEDSGKFPSLPIGLFGHSWGGYSVCSVLTYHPEVKAVIECAGCNRSSDLFEAGGKRQAGDVIYTMMPFVKLHEWVHYGKYASNTALKGFGASDAAVMVVHSEDDDIVPIAYGYDTFYDVNKDDPRFVFKRYKDKGHNDIFNDSTYGDELNAAIKEWRETLDYDTYADENKERFQKDKADYIHAHLDRSKWSNRLDQTMFAEFLAFYNDHLV